MIITKPQEKLTIDTLNALLANFATGIITLDELWKAIEDAEDMQYFRVKAFNPHGTEFPKFPEFAENRMSGVDAETRI